MSAYYPELSEKLGAFAVEFQGREVAVVGHARPDGDCIGSQVALTRLLQGVGVNAFATNADRPPFLLGFLTNETEVNVIDIPRLLKLPIAYVDCADEVRIGPKTSASLRKARHVLNIDHHISNTKYADINLVDATSSATCELIAGMAFDLGWEVDQATAEALYVGILTDTGRFGYTATTAQVFELCSRLVDLGVNPQKVSRHLYENERLPRLKLLERFLGSLDYCCSGRVGVGTLSQKDFLDTHCSYEDSEGFVDYARSLTDVDIGILLEERKTTTKGSLRSKDPKFRMDLIASKFGGGGHACAAGLSCELGLADLREGLLSELEHCLSEAQ